MKQVVQAATSEPSARAVLHVPGKGSEGAIMPRQTRKAKKKKKELVGRVRVEAAAVQSHCR